MLPLEDYQAVQDTAGLCRCRQDREMVEHINKLGGSAVARSSVWFAAGAVVHVPAAAKRDGVVS